MRKGFITLIELLVVISIVGILVTISVMGIKEANELNTKTGRGTAKPVLRELNCDDYKFYAQKDIPAVCIKYFNN